MTAITAMAVAAAIAERNRAQAVLEQQKESVEAANQTKDNFLAMLSHELRTPLTPVIAAIDALEAETSPSDLAKCSLSMIRRNVELESQLIDDLLDLTRIAKDKLQLRFGSIDANEIITNVVEICRAEAQDRRLNLRVNLRAGAHHVLADAAKFQQIIWNLVKNAIKFTGENGDITISTTNPKSQILVFTVKDTGIGIEPEIMNRIFDPFEQGEQAFQRRYGGLGLGLAISKSLTQAHGGTLTAQSDGRDRGSIFTLTMKTVSPPARVVKFTAPIPETRSASDFTGRRSRGHMHRAGTPVGATRTFGRGSAQCSFGDGSSGAKFIRPPHQRHCAARRHRHGTDELSPRDVADTGNRH